MSSARVHCSCIASAPGYAVFLPCILDGEPTSNILTLWRPPNQTYLDFGLDLTYQKLCRLWSIKKIKLVLPEIVNAGCSLQKQKNGLPSEKDNTYHILKCKLQEKETLPKSADMYRILS